MQAVAGADAVPVGRSQALDDSLARAHQLAVAQGHAAVGLEHLLFALTDDPDGHAILTASAISIDKVRTDVSGFMGRLSETMPAGAGGTPQPGADLLRILQLAGMAARQSQRRLMDGAIVLAAIIGDGNSPAAGLLKSHGLTFEAVIRVLSQVGTPRQQELPRETQHPSLPAPPNEPAPAHRPARAPEPPSAETMLASVRARVKQAEPPTVTVKTMPIRPVPVAPMPTVGPPATAQITPEAPIAIAATATQPAAPKPPALAQLRRPGATAPMPQLPPPLPTAQGAARPPLPAAALTQAAGSPAMAPAVMPPTVVVAAPLAQLDPRPPTAQRPPQTGFVDATERAPYQTMPQPAAQRPQPVAMAQPSFQPGPYDVPPPGYVPPQALPPQPARSAVYVPQPMPEPQRGPAPVGPPPGPVSGALSPSVALDLVAAAAGLPAMMHIGTPVLVEVRIPRDQIDVPRRRATPGAQLPPETPVYRAMTVRLGTGGISGLAIEPRTPETVWLEPGIGHTSDKVVWQFVVTPATCGAFAVTLSVTGRTISPYGVSSDAAPTAETFAVKVRRKQGTFLRRVLIAAGTFGTGMGFAWYAGPATLALLKAYGNAILR
jgi:neural Wiskott-Aldrich syndrome protein